MSGILLANIDAGTTAILTKLLKTEGYKVDAADASSAIDKLSKKSYDLAVSTVSAKSADSLELVRKIRAQYGAVPLILIIETSDADIMGRIDEISPFACLEKPLKIDQLLSTVQRAVDFQGLLDSNSVNLNLQLESTYQFEGIVAESPIMKSVCDMISRVAGTDVTVLVVGEKGTGKSLVARTLHHFSRRKDRPLVVADCSSHGAGENIFGESGQECLLDKAYGATLYLRQIEALPVEEQERLAAVLEKKKYLSPSSGKEKLLECRIIASGSGNLEELAAGGELSLALYKMLKIIVIKIPPLRDRPEDVVPTLRMIMQDKLEKTGGVLPNMEQDVMSVLERYPWPGNSKEIDMVASHILASAHKGTITMDALPPQIKSIAR